MTKSRNDGEAIQAPLGIPCGPINRTDEVFADPQAQHLGTVWDNLHPEIGVIRTVRNPVTFSDTPVEPRLPPPRLGQHTDEILRDLLGYSPAHIARLREGCVI